MNAHWAYLKYLVRHKWWVFIGCRRMKVPFLRALTHDWSKFLPSEWFPYVASFYGPQPRTQEVKTAFDRAWLHHIHFNPHHWQHWILREDDGDTKVLQIPETYVREMVADWYGAGKAISGKNDVLAWYAKNREKIVLHDSTRHLTEYLLAYARTLE